MAIARKCSLRSVRGSSTGRQQVNLTFVVLVMADSGFYFIGRAWLLGHY